MRTRIFAFLLALAIFSCEEETKPVDPVYEFIAFKGPATISLNELANSENPFPLVIELKAFDPYPEDIELTLGVTGHNAEENVDFTVTPSQTVKIRAGSLVSDTVFVKTIDNPAGSTAERSFDIQIKSVSKEDIRVGLGITEPRNAAVTVKILDDECTETTDVFNTAALNNTIDWGDGGVINPASGTLSGNTLTVTGDLIGYAPFPNASVDITLTPASEGSTKGSASFGEQETGTDNDGYDYKFVQVGEGTYDVCSGEIRITYDIYYMDTGWTYWYSVTNVLSIP